MNKYRKKELVRMSSGFVSYKIEIKGFLFWSTYKMFRTRKGRNNYFDELIK